MLSVMWSRRDSWALCCSCLWNRKRCEPEYISTTLTDMGLCYTFNANPDNILHSEHTGN